MDWWSDCKWTKAKDLGSVKISAPVVIGARRDYKWNDAKQ